MKKPNTEGDHRSSDAAERRKQEALARLEANPLARRARPQERPPEGAVEITIGAWIPGSRGKRQPPDPGGTEGS